MTKRVTVRVTWESFTELDVDDDWVCPTTLDGFTEQQLELIDGDAKVSLSPIDWEEG